MDLESIARRAERAHNWIIKAAGSGDDGWLPLSVREVFKTDIPWLLAEVERMQPRYQFAEPENNCFIPRPGNYSESMRKLQQAAGWYGGRLIPPAPTEGPKSE